MREATFSDGWRRINDLTLYPLKIKDIKFSNVTGFGDNFIIDFQSGMTAICGKNGVGKSTLLKIIFQKLKNHNKTININSNSTITVNIDNNETIGNCLDLKEEELYYLDPSFECSKIINFIRSEVNFKEFLEGIDSNNVLNKNKTLISVSGCIGKQYKKIEIFEIENALKDDYTFPYFRVTLTDGTEYDSINMGMGEHLCMYILWYMEWINPKSILLLDELENHLSAYSQINLLNHIAYKLSDKKVWTVLTTHSEHILNLVGVNNTRVLYKNRGKTLSVKPKNANRYLRALSLKINKVGVYFVEDKFAKLMLQSIINYYIPDVADTREIITLRCDSNLEKIVKHYEPTPTPFFDLMTVFDADQSDKIETLSKRHISSICLPSKNKESPENEIWNTLINNVNEISDILSVDNNRLDEEISAFEYSDHHDRYYSISKQLNVTFEQLVGAILKYWLNNNSDESLKFVIALYVRNEPISVINLNSFALEFSNENISNYINDEIIQLNAKNVFVSFNGVDLNITKID